MNTTFALWDQETGNLVGAFDTEAAARAVAERALEDQGPESVEALALVHEDEQGHLTTIAEGLDLVDSKDQSAPQRQGDPAPMQSSNWIAAATTEQPATQLAQATRRLFAEQDAMFAQIAELVRKQQDSMLAEWRQTLLAEQQAALARALTPDRATITQLAETVRAQQEAALAQLAPSLTAGYQDQIAQLARAFRQEHEALLAQLVRPAAAFADAVQQQQRQMLEYIAVANRVDIAKRLHTLSSTMYYAPPQDLFVLSIGRASLTMTIDLDELAKLRVGTRNYKIRGIEIRNTEAFLGVHPRLNQALPSLIEQARRRPMTIIRIANTYAMSLAEELQELIAA